MNKFGNLFTDLSSDKSAEKFDDLLTKTGLRIVRIASFGQSTPAGTWYDQDDDEWVMLLKGAARLLIEGEAAERALTVGDWVFLPAHCRHRVTWTDPEQETIWLAVHSDP